MLQRPQIIGCSGQATVELSREPWRINGEIIALYIVRRFSSGHANGGVAFVLESNLDIPRAAHFPRGDDQGV
ncbi:hypothetical protein D3C87_1509040 [compost metagenome]